MDAALAELMAAADKDEADAAAASTNAASTAVPLIVEESGPARPPRGRTRESMAGGGPQVGACRVYWIGGNRTMGGACIPRQRGERGWAVCGAVS